MELVFRGFREEDKEFIMRLEREYLESVGEEYDENHFNFIYLSIL